MNTDEILEFLHEVAASIITPRFRSLSAGDIDEKTPGDYVTIADRESELAIATRLRCAYPDALIVGEEASFADPALTAGLPSTPHAFVIDPVDGTGNFVKGSPDHAVMLAEMKFGIVTRGWIYQPENGVDYVTERGAGVTRNGALLKAFPRAGTLRVESSSRRDLGDLENNPDWLMARTRFCCGIDYPRLLAGDVDALVYRNPKPWDHAPAALMLTQLGAVLRLLDGTTYQPGEPHGVLLAAATEEIWRKVAEGIGA